MSKEAPKTKIDSDGLRYRSKAPGSPFASPSAFGMSTMSCFLCGKHRQRSALKTRKLLGKAQMVCAPSCREANEAAAGGSTASTVTVSTPVEQQ
jgi:hypothetical protein